MNAFIKIFIFLLIFTFNKISYSIDLVESINLSKKNDSLYLIANTKVNIVKENEKQAYSQLLPSISLQISRSQVKQDRKDNLQVFPTQNYKTESDSITLRQPIYRPQLFSELKKAKKLTTSSKHDVKDEEQNLILRVALAYLNVLATVDDYFLQEKKIDLLKEQKRFAEKSIEAGTGTKTDLLEIGSSLDRALATIIQLRQRKEFALSEISILTGTEVMSVDSFNHKNFNPREFEPGLLKNWQDRSQKNNFKILSLLERLSAAKISINSAKFAHYPTLDLSAQIAKGTSESTYFVNSSTETQSVGISFYLPIYSGGTLNSKVRQSIEQLNLETEQLRQLKNQIKIKVTDSFNTVVEKISLIQALKNAEASSKSLLIANERSVELGIRRRLDVLISQQQLISVQKDLAIARFELISAWLSLNYHAGLNLDKEIQVINGFLLR